MSLNQLIDRGTAAEYVVSVKFTAGDDLENYYTTTTKPSWMTTYKQQKIIQYMQDVANGFHKNVKI